MWLKGRGIHDAYLGLYEQGARAIAAFAPPGEPVRAEHVEAALLHHQQGGASQRTLENLAKIGSALVEFHVKQAQQAAAPAPQGGRMVLFVDEDPMVGFEAEQELAAEFDVLWVKDVKAAFAALDEHDEEVCAIVTDDLVRTSAAQGGSGRGNFQRPKVLWERVPMAARVLVSTNEAKASQMTTTGIFAVAAAHVTLPKPWPLGKLLQAVKYAITCPPLPPPE